jgi:hypothetical protein
VGEICITRNFAYSCWLLRDFSDWCEDIAPNIIIIIIIIITPFFITLFSQERKYCVITELTLFPSLFLSEVYEIINIEEDIY